MITQKWEYRQENFSTKNPTADNILGELGSKGWEIISIQPHATDSQRVFGSGGHQYCATVEIYRYFFKRPLIEEPLKEITVARKISAPYAVNIDVLEWKPITEAKKDGTWYLLWIAGSSFGDFGRYIECRGGWFKETDDEEAFYPTHFATVKGPK